MRAKIYLKRIITEVRNTGYIKVKNKKRTKKIRIVEELKREGFVSNSLFGYSDCPIYYPTHLFSKLQEYNDFELTKFAENVDFNLPFLFLKEVNYEF